MNLKTKTKSEIEQPILLVANVCFMFHCQISVLLDKNEIHNSNEWLLKRVIK